MAEARGATRGAGRRRLSQGLVLLAVAVLGGCGLLAAPCRVASAGIKVVPVVGHAAAAPTDACGNAIDP